MKQLSALFISFAICATFSAVAQPFGDAGHYLDNPHVSANAKDFYNGGFKITDSRQARDIADSMCTRNSDTRPFYMYLVCKMIGNTGPGLSCYLHNSCIRVTESRPDAVISFLTSGGDDVKTGFFSKWAGVLAGGYSTGCHTVTDKRISAGLRAARLNCRSFFRDELTTLYMEVRAKVCEDEVIDRVMAVPEVVAVMKKNSKGLSIGVHRGPNKCSNYYWVKVERQEGGEYEELYSFFVEAETFDVCYFDEPNDRIIAIAEWREKLH